MEQIQSTIGELPLNVSSRKVLTKLQDNLRSHQAELTKDLPSKFHMYPLGPIQADVGNEAGSKTMYKIFYLAPWPTPSHNGAESSTCVTVLYSEIALENVCSDDLSSQIPLKRYSLIANNLYDLITGARINFYHQNYRGCSPTFALPAVGGGVGEVRTQGYALAATVEARSLHTSGSSSFAITQAGITTNLNPNSATTKTGGCENVCKEQVEMSKEEILLRERKRAPNLNANSEKSPLLASICDYEFNRTSGRILFSLHGRLYTCTDSSIGSCPKVVPNPLTSLLYGAGACRFDFRMCPYNPYLISFICKGNLWVADLNSGEERQLTFLDLQAEPAVTCGVPSFVMQEEFHRYTGYYWQPTSEKLMPVRDFTEHQVINESMRSSLNVYKILYEEVDERSVEALKLPTCMADDLLKVEEQRFPRPGTFNARSSLKIVEFVHDSSDGRFKVLPTMPIKHSTISLYSWFPWLEYLVRFGWTTNGKSVWVQGLSRDQKRISTYLVPISCFTQISTLVTDASDAFMHSTEHFSSYNSVVLLFTEISSTWINVTNVFRFVPNENPNTISLITLSEETEYRHLYKVTCALTNEPITQNFNEEIPPNIIEKIALTSGEWDVSGEKVWIDECNTLIYFMGHKDTPLEKHLYVTSYAFPCADSVRLTPLGSSHAIHMDKDCRLYVDTFSSLTQPMCVNVYAIVSSIVPGTPQFAVHTRLVGILFKTPDALLSKFLLPPPDIFSFPAPTLHDLQQDSHDSKSPKAPPQLYGMIFKAVPSTGTSRQRPTLLYVYGGPHVQQVTNSYKGHRYMRMYCLAALGFTTVVIDNRGSFNRGKAFETYIYNRMGTVEIDDQIEGLKYIANLTGLIDLTRVAIHGWSYGGYLSLVGLLKRPDVFKLCIAGAPVTTWEQYDTGYTERYMGTSVSNALGYREGDVILAANAFPDEENRLLLVHGLIDENVHFHNTALLIQALIKYNKPYRLLVYPNERHGLRCFDSSQHFDISFLKYLLDYL